VRKIMERRLQARRLDSPWIFHRVCKGKPGQQVYDITGPWSQALKAARLPEGRLFHDLRRSAVRTLVKAGVDRAQAMKVSGHKTEAMFKRYADIFTEEETAAALLQAEAYLDAQPTERNVSAMPAAAGKPVR
jgi:integrase-like protein